MINQLSKMSATCLTESPVKKEAVSNAYFSNSKQQSHDEDSCSSADMLPSPTPSAASSDESEVDGPKYRTLRGNNKQDGDVERMARELARDFITYKVGGNYKLSSEYAETLRRIGDEVDSKYDISLSGIVRKLKYSPERDGSDGFTSSLNTMFEEGPVNWGRVIMVYVFGARLAKYCVENNLGDQVETLIKYTGEYVAIRLSGWINKQGGWDNFVLNFRRKDWREDLTFKALAITGASCGALALLRLFTKA
ncbi:apoptosis regulator BAX-like [Anneissia japonica]|uniref:apoptosis regulator BAX-like n=1 Tax=Anneissia japonica TaxID=1529436 RepID=UPI001425B477|nr:apoptosis regulator BAX-like [Anneissia japonica]